MSITVSTCDLSTSAIGIDRLTDSPLDRRVECWPPTSGVELPLTPIEINTTLTTGVYTIFEGISILSLVWHLCPLADDDTSFFGSEGVIIIHRIYRLSIILRFCHSRRESVLLL
jgi:hypothetical protein